MIEQKTKPLSIKGITLRLNSPVKLDKATRLMAPARAIKKKNKNAQPHKRRKEKIAKPW